MQLYKPKIDGKISVKCKLKKLADGLKNIKKSLGCQEWFGYVWPVAQLICSDGGLAAGDLLGVLGEQVGEIEEKFINKRWWELNVRLEKSYPIRINK